MKRRKSWLIVLLVLFIVGASASVILLTTDGDGSGTRVRAQLVGTTAEDVAMTQRDNLTAVRADLASELAVSRTDIRFRTRANAVEVFSENVSRVAFARALNQNGFDVSESDIRNGVTAETRNEAVRILAERIRRSNLTDVEVRGTTSNTGQQLVVAEASGDSRAAVRRLMRKRGEVSIQAHFPVQRNGRTVYRNVALLRNDDFRSVGTAQPADAQNPQPHVPVTLKTKAAQNYSNAMQKFGFTSEGVANCPIQRARRNPDNASGYCLYTVLDGEVVYAARMSRGLADEMESGNWAYDPRFVMTTTNLSEARELQTSLNSGALPTALKISE